MAVRTYKRNPNRVWNPEVLRPQIRTKLKEQDVIKLALFDEMSEAILWNYILEGMANVDTIAKNITDFFNGQQRANDIAVITSEFSKGGRR